MLLSQIAIYPIKSCRGIQLDRAEVTPKGFLWDREFMLVDEMGKFITQRNYSQLAKIQVKIVNNTLILSTSESNIFTLEPTLTGQEIEVEIWRDRTLAIDQGDTVSQWFHQALNLDKDQTIHLVRQSPQQIRSIDKNYVQRDDLPVSFADGYPFLLTNTASLEELNQRLEKTYSDQFQKVPMNRFRPNLVIDTPNPFIEGTWKEIQIGEITFTIVKPCSRCIITTTDQFTGERNRLKEPLKTLATFRQFPGGIMFGENLIPQVTGILKTGDSVKLITLREITESPYTD
jgi:uncharacterized protein YcbX